MAGLLAHLLEQADDTGDADRAPRRVTRLNVDFLRPVPRQPLEARPRVIHEGGKIEHVEVELAAGEAVAHALALRARCDRIEVPPQGQLGPPPDTPDQGRPPESAVAHSSPFFEGIDFRVVDGDFRAPGPATVWCRVNHVWLAGSEPTGLMRAVAATDTAYGLGWPLSLADWRFVNVDLSIQLHRQPTGDWLRVEAATDVGPDGIAVGHATVADLQGLTGHVLQTVAVTPRTRRT